VRRDRKPAVLRQAEADAANAAAQWKAHRATCGVCAAAHRAGQWARTCDTGWAHVKYGRITAAQLAATVTDIERTAPVQGRLF
jgi:hypothetical protein